MQPAVTVIMPSLNVARYINECMDSVLGQTLKNIEVICVDAGSTDGTLEILEAYEQADERVHLLVSEKKSYGYQMNLGLSKATGKYIGIVETDDWIEPTMFETLYQKAESNSAEVVRANYYWHYAERDQKDVPFENLKGCVYDTVFNPKQDMTVFTTTPSIWSAIYSLDFLVQNGIKFNETGGASYQDTSFHFMVMSVASRVLLIEDYLLHYRKDNEASSVNTGTKVFCLCDEMRYYEEYMRGRKSEWDALSKPYMAWKYEKYRWNFTRISPEYQWEFLEVFYQQFCEHRDAGLLNESEFDESTWKALTELLYSPVLYFKKRCKKYATRPQGDSLPKPICVVESTVSNPDATIVIPAFNEAGMVGAAIESARHQTLRSIEIIVVDDGSSDDTLRIACDEAARDNRISVLTQCNQGLSSSRNAAMRIAKGRYIQFLDADDTLRKDAIEHLVSHADEKSLDVLFFDGESDYETLNLRKKHPYYIHGYEYDREFDTVLTGKEYFCQAIEDGKYRVSACMSLVSLDFLKANSIYFIDGILHEDNAYTFQLLVNAQRVWHSSERLYNRYVHRGSTMTKRKTFQNVYGFLTCYIDMRERSVSQDYDSVFDQCAAKELGVIRWQVVSSYRNVKNQQACKKKLTSIELQVLESMLAEESPRSSSGSAAEIAKIKKSNSYRIGRAFTLPARYTKRQLKALKKGGPKALVRKSEAKKTDWKKRKPKVLYISSDAYKMSGAFLSEIALNRQLNTRLSIKTHMVLPYWGSGNNLVKAANISNEVIPSTDWIIPVGTIKDQAFYEQKKKEQIQNLEAAARIARIALKQDYNVIHTNSIYSYVGYLASRLAHVPHVWHIREFLEEDQGMEIYCKEDGYEMLRDSEHVVAISNAVYDKYKQIVPEEHLCVIRNGLDPQTYYDSDKTIFVNDKPIFLFISGSKSPKKGRRDLVEACKIVNDKGIDFEIWFVGWCGIELQQMVREAGLWDKTRFFGYQYNTPKFYNLSDVLFMCSQSEAFGRTTVEAMMSGCLVVGADAAGTGELIRDGETGILYPSENPQVLATKILDILENKSDMRAIAQAGQKEMLETMTVEANADNVLKLYKSIMKEAEPFGKAEKAKALATIEKILLQCRIERIKNKLPLVKAPDYAIENAADEQANDERATDEEPIISEDTLVEDTGIKVSVIIPVYNAERFLKQCLQSISEQTLEDIEILCINDGSTDGSLSIMNSFAKKDERFRVISKPNGGYGAAVNLGISESAGKYIAIVEADDFISPDMLKHLYTLAIDRGSVDIVKGSYLLYYDTDDGEGETKPAPIKAACHPPLPVFDVWEYPEIIYHHPSIWSCLYRRDFLLENNIRFIEAKSAGWVDNPFLLSSFCSAKRVAWTSKALYYYRQTNPDASSNVKDCRMPFERTSEMLEYLEKNGIDDPAIRGSVYKRILYNAASTLENPNYEPKKDDSLIVEQIAKVDPSFLAERRVKQSERDAYYHFVDLGSKEN